MGEHDVRPATEADAAAICRIYNQGIEDRVATLETERRTPEEASGCAAAARASRSSSPSVTARSSAGRR